MRPTRVIYVENDPALRGIVSRFLAQRTELEVVLTASNGSEVLDSSAVAEADVALLDLALGMDQMNGIDLGIALRERNPNIGIVIHSQHTVDHLARRVPEATRIGWSFLPKSGDMDIDDLVSVLRVTARGIAIGNMHQQVEDNNESPLDLLSPRQRAVMALASSGMSAPQVAKRLGVSHDSVRHDLSRAYKHLVPEAEPGDDLRTRAILTYLQAVRDSEWDVV